MNQLMILFKRFGSFLLYHTMLFCNVIALSVYLSTSSIKYWSIALLILAYVFAGLGSFFINDWFDEKSDLLAGKRNLMSRFKRPVSFIIIAVCWGSSFALIASLSLNASVFLLAQLLLLLLYSAAPFRFKERGILGVMIDAVYAHIIPTLIAFVVLEIKLNQWSTITLLVLLFALGFKDILVHQMEDSEMDLKSKTKTFYLKNPKLTERLISISNLLLGSSILVSFVQIARSHDSPWAWLTLCLLFFTLSIIQFKSLTHFLKGNGFLRIYIYASYT